MSKKKVTEPAVVPAPVVAKAEQKTMRKPKTVAAMTEKTVKPTVVRKKAAPKVMAEAPADSMAQLAAAIEVPIMMDAREVEERAYLSWVARGCPMGSPHEDWFRAERELLARMAGAAH